MPKPPSRSEIETALSGREKKTHHTPKKNHSSDLDFGEPPRRQQVIGGNLAGVNKRKKFGLFSRYNEFSVANWVAAFVIILIVAAFFWPQQKNSVTEIAKQLDQHKVIAIDDQPIEQAASGNAGFARDSDQARVDAYRAQDEIDQQVSALLAQADEYLSARQFTQPRDANAVSLYQQVLSLRPNNPDALENLSKIRRHYLFRGVTALDEDKPSLAKRNLKRLALVDKNSTEYADLESDIKEYAIDSDVAALLEKASQAFNVDRLTIPTNNNALEYYRQVLTLRPNNLAAKEGIQRVADTLIDKANASVLNGNLSVAKAQVETVSQIDPTHTSIPLLQAMIENAKPLNESNQTGASTWVSGITDTQLDDPNKPSETTDSTTVNPSKTPRKQADEQAIFDKQYLQQGLNAYNNENYSTAIALLQPLADKGIARAQIRLAYMHFLGRGFAPNQAEAAKIVRTALPAIRKFANEGRSWAQCDLGHLYEDGLVLPQNFNEAVYWYRSSAEKGFSSAQTNLGLMYARGKGVTSNRQVAIEWLQRAANQGDRLAKRSLDEMNVVN